MAAWGWYTRGRRIPTLIGKDVSGRRIPGGPYTGVQAVTAAVVPAILWWTRELWAADMTGLAMLVVLAGVTVGAVKLVGKVDFASRNPLLLLGGYLRQAGRPMSGTLAGRKLAEPRPHRLAGAIDVTYASLEALDGTAPRASDLRSETPARSSMGPTVLTATAAEVATSTPSPATVATPRPAPPQASEPRTTYAGQAQLQPSAPPAPDRRRSGLEAFLAGAAAVRARDAEEEAA